MEPLLRSKMQFLLHSW